VESIQRAYNDMFQQWKVRRRGCNEISDMILENLAASVKKNKFFADRGIESDENCNIDIKQLEQYVKAVKPLDKKIVKGKAKK
jgi:hypothetical protein